MNSFISAVIFDMDGVIIDTEPLYTKAEIRLFGDYGVTIPEEDWPLFRGCGEQDFFDLSMERYNINEDKDVFMAKGREYVRDEFTKNMSFMPGFHDLHGRVQKHHKIGLVTASPRHNLDWLQGLIGLNDLFQHIISGDDTARNKPHPDPYLAMIALLNVKPENTVIIEDSLHGLRSALSAGCHVIAKRGSVPEEKLSIAHRVVGNLNEITLELIEELLQEKI